MLKNKLASNKRSRILLVCGLTIIVLLFVVYKTSQHASAPARPESHTSQNSSHASNTTAQAVNDEPNQAASLSVVVNKGRILPSTYVPANLVVPNVPLRTNAGSSEMEVRSDSAAAMEKMFAAAQGDGLHLMLSSGYRSYSLQVTLYNGYVASSGQAYADISSARPGHSEHQTGLAADLEPASRNCEVADCFGDTTEGKWLANNSYKYGFIIRYPKGKENLTGYEYEPWHVRYLGVDLATKVHTSGKTLEQYFDLPNYATYPTTSYQLH